jgi:hypothetical protein
MDISAPLFERTLIRLGLIDHETDPEIEARWTNDPAFMRMMNTDPIRPLSVFQVKKRYELSTTRVWMEKHLDDWFEHEFSIRMIEGDLRIGITGLGGNLKFHCDAVDFAVGL